jgi:hypothetical protein
MNTLGTKFQRRGSYTLTNAIVKTWRAIWMAVRSSCGGDRLRGRNVGMWLYRYARRIAWPVASRCWGIWIALSQRCNYNLKESRQLYVFRYRHTAQTVQLFMVPMESIADHNGRAVSGMNYLRLLKHWGKVFESHSRYTCLWVLIPYLCRPVCR